MIMEGAVRILRNWLVDYFPFITQFFFLSVYGLYLILWNVYETIVPVITYVIAQITITKYKSFMNHTHVSYLVTYLGSSCCTQK